LQDMDLIRRCPWNCRVPGIGKQQNLPSAMGVLDLLLSQSAASYFLMFESRVHHFKFTIISHRQLCWCRACYKNKRLKNCILDLPSSTKKNTTLNSKS
jgi:hypothetical protein